jgi:hypothetical protein
MIRCEKRESRSLDLTQQKESPPIHLPMRTRDDNVLVTDTRVWNHFELRRGDIILSTPPTCGTTWSTAILMMLRNGKADSDRLTWQDSLWPDCGFRDQPVKADLDART